MGTAQDQAPVSRTDCAEHAIRNAEIYGRIAKPALRQIRTAFNSRFAGRIDISDAAKKKQDEQEQLFLSALSRHTPSSFSLLRIPRRPARV
jgi:hypothetical protein